MQVVAAREASKEQLRIFQEHVDELTEKGETGKANENRHDSDNL
jgi:hypothetical protein